MMLPPVPSDRLVDSSSLATCRARRCNDAFGKNEAQTVFRKWPEDVTIGPVPGLRDAFKEAGLASYDRLAETWCDHSGAAFIDELLEYEEDLCSALGLDTTFRMRLHRSLLAHLGRDSDASADSYSQQPRPVSTVSHRLASVFADLAADDLEADRYAAPI